MTRLLFCFFADATGIFGENRQFARLVQRSRTDGKDLGALLTQLFQVLDTPRDARQPTLDEDLAAFEYINGSLFAESARIPAFDHDLRTLLLESAELDWSGISPAIFGAMFQGVLEQHHPHDKRQATRRELGAHYTSERNILRVIHPLCLDDLHAELHAPKRTKATLRALYDTLPTLTFLDPACGCGNFLVIAYRELRRLEMDLIAALWGEQRGVLDVSTLCRVNVHQFYGIEIDESAAHIARVALWITDHQMNLEAAERFGTTRPTVPLVTAPTIVCANALHKNWRDVLPPEQCSYILGNPPFVGKKEQTASQKADMLLHFSKVKGAGVLDYVAAWYVKATAFLAENPRIDVAFVSTNSITQGEQVGVLWPWLLGHGVRIRFAHRTFQWSNEGKGVAAVHCVIVGFGLHEPARRTLYTYPDGIKAEPTALPARNINPYLVDAPDVLLERRSRPLCAMPILWEGITPLDDGILSNFTEKDREAFVAKEPASAKWFRLCLTGNDFINSAKRYCLWLVGASPADLRAMPEVMKLAAEVRRFRLSSKSSQMFADQPTYFRETQIPHEYLLIPKTSSERRLFAPIGFVSDVIATNSALYLADATLYHFGMLSSTMHNAWLRAVGGRLKSDYRYSASIVYNNFPWPEPTEAQRQTIEAAGQAILDARVLYPESTLADLYDPLAMPAELRKAHQANDRTVDAAYGYRGGKDDAARIAFLFELYQQLAGELTPAPRGRRKAIRA
ncbi:DNA methyltransferase [Thiomonas sp.]|uniref:class I SAM-dependent DNA methyltransferase n=1 Tax=Thiomonas sp. TaxID=2047785 RepID=UPI002585EF09|nr:DNA methyltransferase [Thiomonas sp.]